MGAFDKGQRYVVLLRRFLEEFAEFVDLVCVQRTLRGANSGNTMHDIELFAAIPGDAESMRSFRAAGKIVLMSLQGS